MSISTVPFDANVIDITASGTGRESFPVEVAIVLASGQHYEALIKPVEGWNVWSKQAERLHGIPLQRLEQFGKSVEQVCNDINRLCEQYTVYSDCWVMDNYWLDKLYFAAGIEKTIRCSPIEAILDDEQLVTWKDKKLFIDELFDHHPYRALDQANTVKMGLNIFFSEYIYEGSSANCDEPIMATA